MSEPPAEYTPSQPPGIPEANGQPLFSVEPWGGFGVLRLKYARSRKVWLIGVEDVGPLIEALRPFDNSGRGR